MTDSCTTPLAQEDHTYNATRKDRTRHKGRRCFTQHNPGTNTAATRQREDFSGAISEFRQGISAAVACGESISAHETPSQRAPQSQEQRPQLYDPAHLARRNVEQMCKRMSPGTAGGHHPLPICGPGGKTGTRRSVDPFCK